MNPLKRILLIGALGLLAASSSGCGGFAASRSVSPLDFIMPRVMEPRAVPQGPVVPPSLLAQNTNSAPTPRSPD